MNTSVLLNFVYYVYVLGETPYLSQHHQYHYLTIFIPIEF